MKDGQCHGKGVFQYADGDRYPCSPAREIEESPHARSPYPLASRFEGEYVEGQMNGLGVYRWSNGRRAHARAQPQHEWV